MPSTIILSDNGASSGSAGIKTTGGNDGVLLLQTTTSGGTATTAVTLDNNQNMGLGVTPSAWLSSFRSFDIGTTGSLAYFSSGTYLYNNTYYNSGGTQVYKGNGYAQYYTQNSSGSHVWGIASNNVSGAGATATFTQAMTLDASGRLLVGGTTAPTGSAILLLNSNNGVQLATTVSGGGNITPISGGGLQFFNYTGAVGSESYSEKARIDSSGNLLVGTTSYSDGSMFYKPSNTALNCWRGTTTATDGIFGAFSNIGGTQTVRAYFRSDGGLANYSANNVNLSDENLKKDISLAGNYLAKICAIPVKNFRYKDQSESEDITLGVIAQDVLAVAPELVSQEGFGMDEESKQNYLSVYQTDLQYALMKAIQELKAIVDAQAAEIAALKGQA